MCIRDRVERFGSLAGVLDAAEEELCRVPGVGQHTAVLLKLIPAAGARYLQSLSLIHI